jgi:hypothetical protein
MARVIENLVSGETATNSATGFTVNRKIIVAELFLGSYGVPGGLQVTKDNVLNVAIEVVSNYTRPGLEGYFVGAVHPGIPRCFVREQSPRLLSKDVVEVTLTYESFLMAKAKISFAGGVESVETNRGWLRGGITLAAIESENPTYQVGLSDITVQHGTKITGPTIQSNIAVIQLSAEQDEIKTNQEMLLKVGKHLNTLNSGNYLGFIPGCWYCQDIHADRLYSFGYGEDKPEEGGELGFGLYTVRYTLVYRLTPTNLFWDHDVYYIDSETGRPPSDLVIGTGRKRYRTTRLSNFTEMEIRGLWV